MPSAAYHDVDTLPFVTEGDFRQQRRSVCLTVLVHPDAAMIGARAFLHHLEQGRVTALSRLSPEFRTLAGGPEQPLADPYVSRQPTLIAWRDGLVLTPSGSDSRVAVAGQALQSPRTLPRSALERGVVLELSNRTAVLLHLRGQPLQLTSHGLVGGSEALDDLRSQIDRAAPFGVPVLLTGETGVGKELVARALHGASPRRSGPWVSVNVAEIKSETAASVLFGHVRGAFTGATGDHDGVFVRADGGTLFLDEIGEMAPDVQAMLLRVLETGEVRRLGDRRTRTVDVRVIAASDHVLDATSPLRSPLLYRLAGYRVHVPPLRDRLDDLGPLLAHFRDDELRRVGRPTANAWLPAGLVARLVAHSWPGNAREVRNLMRALVIGADGDRLGHGFQLDAWLGTAPAPVATESTASAATDSAASAAADPLADAVVAQTLSRNNWNLVATARDLGIARSTLYQLIDRSATLRKAADVPAAELAAAAVATDGDVDKMAQRLRVSPRGLRLALRSGRAAADDGPPPVKQNPPPDSAADTDLGCNPRSQERVGEPRENGENHATRSWADRGCGLPSTETD